MSQNELEEKIGQIAGEAYGKGADAEDVAATLETVKERFVRLAEVEQ